MRAEDLLKEEKKEKKPIWGMIGREFELNQMKNGIAVDGIKVLLSQCLIDLNRYEHWAMIAKSGGGKSYSIRVLLEEFLKHLPNHGYLMIDPIGALTTMDTPNSSSEIAQWNQLARTTDIVPCSYKMVVWVPEGDKEKFDPEAYHRTFSIKANALTVGLLCFTFGFGEFDQPMNLYRRIYNALDEQDHDFTLQQMINKLTEKDTEFKNQTVDALVSRLEILKQLKIVSEIGVDIQEVIKKGQVAIFDFSQSSSITARVIMFHLMNQALSRRLQVANKLRLVKTLRKKGHKIHMPNRIPIVHFFLDEAREFLVNNPNAELVAKKGRNAGFLLTSISQSPDLPSDIYANASHFLLGHMLLEDDIKGCKSLVPTLKEPKEFREALQGLDTGQFYYYYTGGKAPIEKRIKIRASETMHLSSTEIDDEDQWFDDGDEYSTNNNDDLTNYLEKQGYPTKIADVPKNLLPDVQKHVKENHLKIEPREDGDYLQKVL
jgi:hypothetical protein